MGPWTCRIFTTGLSQHLTSKEQLQQFFLVYTTYSDYSWWFGGWFIVALATLPAFLHFSLPVVLSVNRTSLTQKHSNCSPSEKSWRAQSDHSPPSCVPVLKVSRCWRCDAHNLGRWIRASADTSACRRTSWSVSAVSPSPMPWENTMYVWNDQAVLAMYWPCTL